MKFLARARQKGFAELLLPTAIILKESKIDALRASSPADDEKLVSNYDKPSLAMMN